MTISVPEFEDASVVLEKLKSNPETMHLLQYRLMDPHVPLDERFRILFTLKNMGTLEAIEGIQQAFKDSSALFKHEAAYVLGQMKNKHALPCLENVLRNQKEDPMVRHEVSLLIKFKAAEAIGAIGSIESVSLLEEFVQDREKVVAETCQLAIHKIKFDHSHNEQLPRSPFTSVDPAPPFSNEMTLDQLEKILLDTELDMFNRYRAMFTLRNIGSETAVKILSKGFQDPSALFRHEIAYVFGQLQHPASVPALKEVLQRSEEVPMVRHESAEALGSIATESCLPLLETYQKDTDRVVRESCQVALDMYSYETSGSFHYGASIE